MLAIGQCIFILLIGIIAIWDIISTTNMRFNQGRWNVDYETRRNIKGARKAQN